MPDEKVEVVGVGFPFHGKSEQVHVEALHRGDIADVQGEMAQAGVGGAFHKLAP